jgi:hypothetical protein
VASASWCTASTDPLLLTSLLHLLILHEAFFCCSRGSHRVYLLRFCWSRWIVVLWPSLIVTRFWRGEYSSICSALEWQMGWVISSFSSFTIWSDCEYYWWVFLCCGRQHYRRSCFFTAAWTMFNARWVRWRSYSELWRSWRKREGGFWKPIDLLLRLTAGLWFWLLLNWRLWRILLQCPE